MLSINTLVEFIKGLEGVISEPARSEVAHRLAALISDMLKDADNRNYKQWIAEDRLRFLRHCEVVNLERWVPDDLHIAPTDLAEFCNRWLSCNLFKLRNDPAAEWRPITPEQNSLRVTMVEELKEIAKNT
jgi:hypothetical protein